MPSISSDAMAARWPPHSFASISTSLAMMSSFFWISPCTFSLSALPITSPSAPLLTLMLMLLQARATTSISKRSSAGMLPCRRCCSTRYRVRLMGRAMVGYRSKRISGVCQRASDDLAHVARQVGLGRHAAHRLARRAAVGLGQAAPAVHHARQARGELRVDAVEFEHAVGPEHIARGIGAMECGGGGH